MHVFAVYKYPSLPAIRYAKGQYTAAQACMQQILVLHCDRCFSLLAKNLHLFQQLFYYSAVVCSVCSDEKTIISCVALWTAMCTVLRVIEREGRSNRHCSTSYGYAIVYSNV
jgi:hypothetical protein